MYQESSLIMSKLNIPTISTKVIKRTNLFKKLDKFVDYRLTVVTAPAGYGKTTLTTSWLSEKKKNKLMVAWLSLDEGDNDPEYFWSYFLLSVNKKISEINVEEEAIKDSYHSSATFNKLQLSHFINTVNKFDEEILIVIDDFHLITDERIIENMKFFIKNMATNMHILLLSRNILELGLPRLRAADSILEINQYDLCFTSDETIEFFNKTSGMKLPYDSYNNIWNESEGWIAGIQMMALSIKNSSRKTLVEQGYKNNIFVFDYIAEEVFLNLEEGIKKFLLYTSIVDEFSCELCDYLLEIDNSHEFIKKIEVENLFLVSMDNEQNWFRYHNLFRNFLRKQLDRLGEKMVHQLFNKIAQWYEKNKWINKAVESYIKGANFRKAASLMEQVSGEVSGKGQVKLLHKWNQMLPADIVKNNIRLIMNSAWAAVADGEIGKVSEYIKMVQDYQRISFYNLSKGNKEVDSSEIDSSEIDASKIDQGYEDIDFPMKVEIVALNSTNITRIDDIDKIILQCEELIPLLKETDFLAQLIVFNVARAYFLRGELSKAVGYFEKSLLTSIKTKETYFTIITNKALIIHKKLQGRYREAKQDADELISRLKINGDMVFPVAGILYAELADIYYQWNEIDKSMEVARKGLALGLAGEDSWVIAENNLILAKIYNAMNLEKEYADIADKTKEYLDGNKFFDTSLKLDSFNANVMLNKGTIKPVLNWLSDIVPVITDNLIVIYPEVFIVKVRLYIYENQFDKARILISDIEQNAKQYQLNKLLVEIEILSARVYQKLGYITKAIIELEKAVEISWKQNITRLFLDEGSWMEDMLKKLRKKNDGDGKNDIVLYIDHLLAGFNSNATVTVIEEEELLSKREIEILQFLEQGATNSEMSEKFFISINTVKTHLLNIYTKLDVHSRTRAVAKAKELKLI